MVSSQRSSHPPGSNTAARRRARQVVARLAAEYPDVTCALTYRNPFELLIATILSAQCTDKQVNQVTKDLFSTYPTAAHFAHASRAEIEQAIRSTGFFHNKAKNIQACCLELVERYDGAVPRDIEALVALPGIGRKTANVVLGTAYGLATGVVVDTHVGRICRRLGLTAEQDANKVERDLIQILPRDEWVLFSHRMIRHGRQVCAARKPRCDACSMKRICPKIGVRSPSSTGT